MFSPLGVSDSRVRKALLACGIGLGVYVAAALVEPLGADLPRHVLFFGLSFVLYLVAVFAVLRRSHETPGSNSGRVLATALVWAVVLRLALLATTPSLSDDVFRYVWDGKVAASGVDPYRYPPSAPELAGLRDPLWNGINAKSMHTPYPPLAEGLFVLLYRLAPDSLTAMQAAAVAFDLGVILLILLLLGRLQMDRYRVLIYAWNPLTVVQFAHSGHFDASMILLLLAAIYLLALGMRIGSGIMLGAAALVKLVPAITAPIFVPLWGAPGVAAAVATVGVGFLPLVGGPALAGILSEASEARFNDSAGYVLTRILGVFLSRPDLVARAASNLALVVASLSIAVAIWRRGGGWQAVIRSVYWLIGLFLVLNAVVEPWYLTWILPFLCFALPADRSRFGWLFPSVGWLMLSGTVMLTDLTYAQGVGGSAWIWIRLIEYGPLYAMFGHWAWREWAYILPRRSERPGPSMHTDA